jgi:hypothetical protein
MTSSGDKPEAFKEGVIMYILIIWWGLQFNIEFLSRMPGVALQM